MGNFNVDELPDLNEKNSKPKAFNVDELPDLKKKDEPNLKSGSNGSSSSNTTSKSESGFSNGKSIPDFSNMEITGVTGTPVSKQNITKQQEKDKNPKTPKQVLGEGSTIQEQKTASTAKENPYAVDVTQKSDNTKTQSVKNADIKQGIDTGELDKRNPATYLGATEAYKKQAKEITGGETTQNLIEYNKIIGVDDDLTKRLTPVDNKIFTNNKKIQDLYAQLDIYNKQGNTANAKEVQAKIAEGEKVNTQLLLQRNSQIDADILSMQKQLASGTKTIKQSTGNGSVIGVDGLEVGSTIDKQVPLSDDEKSLLKSQIETLKKRKGAFLENMNNPQEVFAQMLPKIKMYEDKGAIPKDASNPDKLKIYYGIKMTQLKRLKEISGQENNSVLFQNNPLLSGLGVKTGDIAMEVVKSVKQRLVDDKTTKAIKDIEGELDAIAPIVALNLDPNIKSGGFWGGFKAKLTDAVTQTTQNNTTQESASYIKGATQNADITLSPEREAEIKAQLSNKDIGQRSNTLGGSIGTTTAFAGEFGLTSVIGGKLLSTGGKLLANLFSPKTRTLIGMAETAIGETKIGRLTLETADEALKYSVTGELNKVLEKDATASQGATGAIGSKLGEKAILPIANLFGKNAGKFISLIGDTFGRTTVELFEETSQNTEQLLEQVSGKDNFISGVAELFKNSDKGKQFVSSLKEQYGDLDSNVDFAVSIFAMSAAFNVGKFGKFFRELAFKERDNLSETEKEQFDAIVHDTESEYEDKVVKAIDDISKQEKKTPEEVINQIVNQNQVQDGKEQKAEGQENVLTGTDQKVEPQVQEDKTNTPAPLESLTAEQKKEVAKDVEAKVLKQKAIDGTLDEYLLGLYNEKIQKENENKGTPVEPVDTGQKQDNGTGVQQPQQDDKSIQQGSGTGQNMPDQEEISVGKQKEEQVKPIRQLGTGANVYFETPKYRVNDSRNGKVYLNIGNELDEVPLRTVEFDNANEAVFVAKKLEEYRPDGLTNEYNVDAIIETLKSEYNNQGTPNEVNQPVQQDASTADKQGNKEAVQQGSDATGQGNAKDATSVLEIERIQKKLNNNEPLNGDEIIIADQNKLVPNNQENIKLAEDENEQQLAESKLTKEDNIEQEPNIKAIESKANSNNEVELNEAVKKADELINASTDVVNVPISEISVNTEEYQGRKKQFSERSANKVHKFFDKNKFDPIVVYKHPNGKTYVLSGHSRFEGMKRRGETTIPARVFEGTPEQAKEFALTSNKNNDLQTDLENAAYYREQLNNGKSYNAVLEEAKANEQQGSAKKIVSMAHLNPDGKTMKSLEALEGTEGDSNTNLVTIATKIGDIRAKNPHLTDAHENELFEYMTQDKDNIPTDKELADQNSQINRSINSVRFDNKEPLNLQKFTNKSDARLAWEAEKKDLESQVAELKKEVNPSKKTGWTGLKEKAIASIAKGNTKEQLDQAERDFENDVNGIKSNYQRLLEKKRAELTAVSNKLAKHLLSEKNLIEGEKNQGSLFSAGTKPNIKTISKKAFDKLIKRLIDAFPNVKVFQDENTLKSKLKEFGVDIAQFLGAFNNKNVLDTEKVKFLRTKDGTIYGAKFPDGSIYINPNELNANTPIHEFGHIWEQAFGARFKAGVEILKQSAKGRALIEQVRNNPFYKNMTPEQIEREALVVAIGNKGEQLFGASNYEKLKQWISDLFKAIKEKLGIKQKLTADETLENFTKGVVGELLGGKVLNEEIGKSAQKDKSGVRYMTLPDGRKVSVRDMGIDVVNGFYSNTEYALAQVKDNKMSGNKWKQQLLSRGAKSDEMQWTGLDQFLSDNNNQSVTKAEIEQFMKDNRISVVEVVKGEDLPNYYLDKEPPSELGATRVDLLGDLSRAGNLDNPRFRDYLNNKYGRKGNKIYDWLVENSKVQGKYSKDTKFSEYQLEGEKENYKEVLVTMPVAKSIQEYEVEQDYRTPNTFYAVNKKTGVKLKFGSYELAKSQAERLSKEAQPDFDKQFKSSHFDEPNILVHLRMNTRTDSEGNKVLFLEEVQSDWGQKGKKEGFKIKPQKSDLEAKWHEPTVPEGHNPKNYSGYWEVYNKKTGELVGRNILPGKNAEQNIEEALRTYDANMQPKAIPSAPFVTDTNAWTKLGLKVALKEAVKQGADKIAWTTGEQQNDRYDLSKQVDEIGWQKNENGTYNITPKKDGSVVGTRDMMANLTLKQVEDYVGKDIAEKIQNDEGKVWEGGNVKQGKLTGQQLKVGGKGMKGFYGEPSEGKEGIVGSVAKALVKELTGKPAEIVETQLQTTTGSKTDNPILNFRDWVWKEKTDDFSYADAKKEMDNNGDLYKEYRKNIPTQHSIDITPELKAQVQEGLPLFKFDSNTINDDVREMKAAGLSEDRIREVLSLSGNTQEEIDKALYDTQNLDSDKQRVADRFVKGDSGFEQAKQMVIDNGYDKGEYDSKQVFDDIDNLIEKSGTDNIEKLLDLPLSEPHRVVLQHRIFEHFGKQSTDETLSEQERKDAFEKSARYLLDLSRQRTEAGRGNAILHQIYLDSDIYFTLPMAQKKMDALGTILSDSEMAEMKEMAQEIERLRKENKDLQELAQKEQDDKIVDDIKNNLLVDELILDSNTKDEVEVKNAKQRLGRNFQKIAEKFGAIKMLDATEKTDFFQILHEMTKDLMTISKIGAKKALKSVIKSVKNQHPDIDNSLLDEAKQYVLAQENEETDIEDSKGNKISKGDLLELIEEGADTMNKLIIAIRDKFHGGDTSVTDKQIRDAITGYGNSMKKDKTTVEKKLSEIKAIMLLQSKLEDALNNIHPKKTGVIREKDTIDVIRLRRQLSEAMKKLKGDMSESEIAGLNERKLTYLGNRIKEVQDVIDGLTTKVDEKAPFEYSQAVKDKQKELDRLMKDQRVLLHYTKEKLTNLVAKYQEKIDKKIYSKEPILSKLIITDNEHEILKNKLKYKKKQLENARDKFRNNNSDYLLNQAQKSIEKQINRIDELIKGISKRKTSEQIKAEKLRKQGIIDKNTNETAVKRLKANQTLLENKKEEWERMLIKKQLEAEMANKSALQRIAGKLIGGIVSLSRTSTLGLIDVGWIGVQGGYFLRTKPKTFAKALNDAYKNGDLDEKSFRDWIKNLKEVPMYEIMLKVGLRIPNQSLKQEIFEQEYRQSKFTDFLDKIPGANLVNKNGRLSVKFLAHLRMETFVDLYNKLNDEQKQDPKTLEKLADFVNVHTGAGGIIGENKSGSLNKWWGVLTSARNTSSMLQQTYLGMIYQGAKNFDSKRGMLDQPILFQQIKHDIYNHTVLFGTLYLAKYIAKYIDKDDDDDEWEIEMNPFSTDYMRLKAYGNKYFDMGGTTSLNVATLRLATMIMNIIGADIDNYKTKDGSGQIGGSKWNDPTGSDILINATVSRLVPFLSFIKNPLQAKKKDGNYYLFGKEYTPNQFRLKILTDMFKPINLDGVISDRSNKQQNIISTISNFLIGALGVGVQPVSEKNVGKTSNLKGYENPYKNNYKSNYKNDYKSGY